MKQFMKTAALVVAAAVALPMYAAHGTADFSRLVILGDSYGAGFSSGSLNERHQVFGWGAILAKQVGLKICSPTASATDNCFAMPLISYPGIPAEPTLGLNGPVPGSGLGAPEMAGFGRPYNNLAVPGYTLGAALASTGTTAGDALGQIILRGLGTEVDQALALKPTFIAIWLGGNDFLGAVSAGDPSKLTPPTAFAAEYKALLDKLTAGAPNAGMVLGTLPESFAAAPLTNTLPPVVFDSNFQPVKFAPLGGATVPLFYLPSGSSTPAPIPAGSVVVLSALPKIQTGFGIPPTLAAFPPFNTLPNVGKPLTDADVITPTELSTFSSTIQQYNATITSEASTRNIPVADIRGLFNRFGSATVLTPMQLGPFTVNNSFIRGGLFSLDGTHLTDIGYTLFADEYIKAINAGYGTHIPLANVSQFLQNNDPALSTSNSITFDQEFASQMIQIFSVTATPQTPSRRRVVGH